MGLLLFCFRPRWLEGLRADGWNRLSERQEGAKPIFTLLLLQHGQDIQFHQALAAGAADRNGP